MPPPRAALLGELSDLVDAALAGQGRLLVVSGEAGIGKSTLIRRLAAAHERTLWGACEPLATTAPLLPLRDWARTAGGDLAAAMAGDDRGHDLFTTVLTTLQRPTLAVIEDVHWADEATLDLLVFLGRRVVDLPSALVLTAREVPARLAGLGRRFVVPPLSQDEVELLTAGTGLDAARVRALTGGNAFFVTQLVDAPTAGVPDSVREAVLARVGPLSDVARSVVETVAVVPDRAELEIVYDATAASPADMESAERAGLLISDGRTIRFRHELAREAVETSMPGARRRARNQAVLDALVRLRPRQDAAIGYHAHLADDHRRALDHGLLAAKTSDRAGARRESLVQLQRAEAHLEHASPMQAVAILRAQAEALTVLRENRDALPVSERALATARELSDPDRLAGELARHAFVLWRLGGTAAARRLVAEALEVGGTAPEGAGNLSALLASASMHMLAREIEESLSAGRAAADLARRLEDRRSLADALHLLGTASWFAAPDEAEPLLLEALELARGVGEDRLVGLIMLNAGSGAGEVRRYERAHHWLAESHRYAVARDLDDQAPYALAWLARICLEQGDLAVATTRALECLDSDLIGRITGHTVLGRARHRLGEAGAQESLDAAWALAAPTGDLQRTWPVVAGYAELGATDHLADVFAQAVELAQPWAIGELGWHLVRLGLIDPGDPRLAGAAAPYTAMIRGEWTTAANLWRELGCRYDAALADAETGDPRPMRDAIAALDAMGARADADRVAARLRALDGSAVRRARRSTAAHPFGLTDRELEVAELLREGLSNAEIATRTFTSVKTVGHHVSAILAKVGVASRREAATRIWAPATDAVTSRPRPRLPS